MEELRRALGVGGEECVIRIRNRSEQDSWCDITGNLRSSVGYGVVEYGNVQVVSNFNQVPMKRNPLGVPLNGSQVGRDYLEQKADELVSAPLALVVVAGMKYAIYVEAKKNKDVIGNTNLWAKQNLSKWIEGACKRATARLQRLVK